jgi:uroporphyrinogen III methyltransferase/synthase
MKKGIVYLVGAGPGDPGLFTIKGKKALQRADAVIYDRLVSNKILSYASKKAERLYVGKVSGDHVLSQDKINELLVQKAREGKVVVRLKGGDPFVFGRGGEEVLYLQEHGCDFEVVPGITSATAVPAYAGIPVTHRDMSSSFAVITGHEKPGKKESSICWKEISHGVDTVVFLMGVENLSCIVEQLIDNGKAPGTPAALIRSGTLPGQEVLTGTLGDIVQKAEEKSFKPSAVFMVGDVVTLREKLSWVEKRPLWGKKVVVTRPEAQAASFVEKITELGGEAIELPAIEIVKETDLSGLYRAFKDIETYDWVVFTSVNAVDIFFDELSKQGLDIRTLKGVSICVIGPVTEQSLEQRGLLADMVPEQYCAEGIIEALKGRLQPGQKILLPRTRGARTVLLEGLQALRAKVDEIYLYKTAVPTDIDKQAFEGIIKGDVDILTFTSSSTVSNFVDLIGKQNVNHADSNVKVACIGPVTADTARRCGFSVDIEAKSYTIDGLVEALVEGLR